MRRPALFLLVALAGCAGGPSNGAGPQSNPRVTYIGADGRSQRVELRDRTEVTELAVAADAAAAWAALPGVFEALKLPVNQADPRTHALGAMSQRVRRIGSAPMSRYLDCGNSMAGPNANLYDIYLSIATRLLPAEGGGTLVRTELNAQAKDAAHNNPPVDCTSTGRLEREIVEALQAAVK